MNCADLLLGLGIEVDVRRHRRPASRSPRSCPGSSSRRRRACRNSDRLLARIDDRLRQVRRARRRPWSKPSLASRRERARLERQALDQLDLLVGVARPAVDRHHARQPELLDVRQVAAHVRHPVLDRATAPCARSLRGSSSMPPWCLIARTVVTSTDGARRAARRSGRRCRRTSPCPCPSRSPTR